MSIEANQINQFIEDKTNAAVHQQIVYEISRLLNPDHGFDREFYDVISGRTRPEELSEYSATQHAKALAQIRTAAQIAKAFGIDPNKTYSFEDSFRGETFLNIGALAAIRDYSATEAALIREHHYNANPAENQSVWGENVHWANLLTKEFGLDTAQIPEVSYKTVRQYITKIQPWITALRLSMGKARYTAINKIQMEECCSSDKTTEFNGQEVSNRKVWNNLQKQHRTHNSLHQMLPYLAAQFDLLAERKGGEYVLKRFKPFIRDLSDIQVFDLFKRSDSGKRAELKRLLANLDEQILEATSFHQIINQEDVDSANKAKHLRNSFKHSLPDDYQVIQYFAEMDTPRETIDQYYHAAYMAYEENYTADYQQWQADVTANALIAMTLDDLCHGGQQIDTIRDKLDSYFNETDYALINKNYSRMVYDSTGCAKRTVAPQFSHTFYGHDNSDSHFSDFDRRFAKHLVTYAPLDKLKEAARKFDYSTIITITELMKTDEYQRDTVLQDALHALVNAVYETIYKPTTQLKDPAEKLIQFNRFISAHHCGNKPEKAGFETTLMLLEQTTLDKIYTEHSRIIDPLRKIDFQYEDDIASGKTELTAEQINRLGIMLAKVAIKQSLTYNNRAMGFDHRSVDVMKGWGFDFNTLSDEGLSFFDYMDNFYESASDTDKEEDEKLERYIVFKKDQLFSKEKAVVKGRTRHIDQGMNL